MSFDLNMLGTLSARLPPRSQPPSHRHGTPSGPWPFLDISDEIEESQIRRQPKITEEVDEEELTDKSSTFHWSKYPQSQFANWTPYQQKKSGISGIVNRKQNYATGNCSVYKLDVSSDGTFHADKVGANEGDWVVKAGPEGSEEVKKSMDNFWENLSLQPPPKTCVRALFVDNLSGPVLQMLGARFNIEPFFFSSSLNGIPSRYQEQAKPGTGDHITITLNFIRTVPNPSTVPPTPASSYMETVNSEDSFDPVLLESSYFLQEQIIDIEGPLVLRSSPDKFLMSDLLALHVIRRNIPNSEFPAAESDQTLGPTAFHRAESSTSSASRSTGGISTIISYHPPSSPPYRKTSARNLHARLLAAGRSVYWSRIFSSTVPSGDPTFVVLSLLWYAMYAWDEALEVLLGEVGWLESHTLSTLPRPDHPHEDAHEQTQKLTHQLHVVRAHLLHYENLLSDFNKSVLFLLNTVNPAFSAAAVPTPSPRPRTPASPSGESTRSPSQGQGQESTGPEILLTSLPEFEGPGRASTLMSAAQDAAEEVAQSKNETDTTESHESLLRKECTNLLDEIQRIERTRAMLDKRLGNVMALAFSSVNIEDSRRMQKLAETSGRDSAVMKQISYLTMIFLPASFVATVFGMNVVEITGDNTMHGTLPHYFAAAIPLTCLTVWIMMLQYNSNKERRLYTPSTLIGVTPPSIWGRLWSRVWWPLGVLLKTLSPWSPTGRRRSRWSMSATAATGTKSRIASARTSVREGERGRERAESWVRGAAIVLAGRSNEQMRDRDRDRYKGRDAAEVEIGGGSE